MRRILGDEPFADIGAPDVVASNGVWTLVGGDLGWLGWHGDMTCNTWWQGWRLGVYWADDLRLEHLLRLRWPVRSIAFHPSLPFAAVGTGGYDGGYLFNGELLLVDLESGWTRSMLDADREVRLVEWLDDRTLRLLVAPHSEDWEGAGTHGHEFVLERDWTWADEHTISLPPGDEPLIETPAQRGAEAELLELFPGWTRRRQVWDVARLDDGRVLAVLEGIALEAWLASGEREWVVLDEAGGRQIAVAPDERSAMVNISEGKRLVKGRWMRRPGRALRVALADGNVLETFDNGTSMMFTTRNDGWLALRDARYKEERPQTRLVSPEGVEVGRVALGRYDSGRHVLRVRNSPELYFLQGRNDAFPSDDTWIVSVGVPEGEVRWLFPLEWEAKVDRLIFGGPAVRVGGGALVHGGGLAARRGRMADAAYIVRRRLSDGAVDWLFRGDFIVTVLEADGDTVYAALRSGEILALDAADGTVRWRTEIPGTPLSMSLERDGRMLIGTAEGRVLDCEVTTTT
ncbi:PQQ-binding-like beta-propeller repeat protein [Actinomadura rudentiformis]|uniref:PQQ-binding-like beta-propeller repeat protein n=1 Tax=Actinomadura rudentiformis TaxID=359158 RepID=A0A6H9YNY5_9ACTN|nr:PQQ-binding-like beta-propeller repeat protein [Actinomadura rudentiformis]KAB2340642.1 PQQ-binding-like beta-propeller repeat protein [Actinomadura rudentiformis]